VLFTGLVSRSLLSGSAVNPLPLSSTVIRLIKNTTMPTRFRDQSKSVYSFSGHFLIECPHCHGCAEVNALLLEEKMRRLTLSCQHCGYSQRKNRSVFGSYLFSQNPAAYEEGAIGIGSAVDWYFHQPLWLQTSCGGDLLWAYNAEHLRYLQGYVGAQLRERRQNEAGARSNGSLASRLPKWLQQAKNREQALRCIEKLKQKLASGV